MHEGQPVLPTGGEVGTPVKWVLKNYRSLSETLGDGFAIMDGVWSIGYNEEGKAVEARRFYPDDKQDMEYLNQKNMAKLQKIHESLHPKNG